MANKKTYSPVGANFYSTSTLPQESLGATGRGSDASEWVYVKATEALAVGQGALVKNDFTVVGANNALANTNGWSLAIPQTAFAANEYGWMATAGVAIKALSAASFAGKGAPVSVNNGGVFGSLGQAITGLTFVANTGGQQVAMDAIAQNISVKQ